MLTSCPDNNDATTSGEGEDGLKTIQIECSKVQQTPFAQQSNKFANKFFGMVSKEAKDKNVNLCISPISMQYILSIYANGLADKDAQAVLDLLDMGSLEQVNANSSQLLNLLNEDDEYVKVAMVNGLWKQSGYNDVLPSFVETIQTYYQADTKDADFQNPEEAKKTINNWVSEKTDGQITDANLKISEKALTQLAWVNVTSFDAKWTYPFSAQNTMKGDFTNIDGTVSKVDMMKTTMGNVLAYSGEDVYMMELPYGKGYYSMIVGLPYDTEKLDSICANTDWWKAHEQARGESIELYMPKFTISTDLASLLESGNFAPPMLEKMGLDQSAAEAEMVKATNPARQIWGLSQSATIEVEENGTKAVTVTSSNDGMYYSSTVPRRIDRPFFFAIRENTTGAILYMGKVVRL